MKNRIPTGFTITEMMLAMAVMSVILLITITFFRNQSQMAGTNTRERSSRQSIVLALNALQRDIQQGSYGLAKYPQLAFMFGDNWNINSTHPNNDRKDVARYTLPVYGTIWISYGQYLKSSIPLIPGTNTPYTMWPSLVYNLDPLSNNDIVGGIFKIPAASNAEATANANNVGAIIVWPWTNASTPGPELNRSVAQVTVPGTVGQSLAAGTTNSAPPSKIFTQFTVQNSPAGIFRFAPVVVYNFVVGSATSPGFIERNSKYQPGVSNQPLNTFLGDSSLFIWDFQIRAYYSTTDGLTQAWMPDAGVTLPAGLSASNLRYIETRIVYTVLDPDYSGSERYNQIQDGQVSSITKTIRVSPRTVVLSSY
jgi:prepilin-type N-terminal cleavage/methylation domain-containing protein